MKKTLLASALLLASNGALASAFQLAEVSSSGLGRAYAGEAAIADNASVVATNPALMTKFKQSAFSIGAVYIDSKINLSGDTTYALAPAVSYSADQHSIVPGSLVPNLYYVTPINDRFAVGAGMNVNFGLRSEYNDDYSAGVFGGRTDLTALNFNLSGAYRISDGWSVGLGVNAVYAQAEVKRTTGVLSSLLTQTTGTSVASGDTLVHLQDNTWGFGWNVGLLYEFNENNRLGFAYHSKVDLDFKDNTAFSYQYAQTGLPYAYTSTGRLTLPLPAYWEISGYHKLTSNFAVHYSYKYTQWSRFEKLKGVYDNGNTAFEKEEFYQDSSRIALGVSYDVNDQLTLRAGIAYDEAAVSPQYASASIPDTDRTWYSLGATYKFTPNLSLDIGFAHLRGKNVSFTETYTNQAGIAVVQTEYRSKSRANLYGINLNYLF